MKKNKLEKFAFKLDENNRFIIGMTIIDKTDFLSPYCGDVPIIGSEVAAYLENSIKYVPPSFDISLRIKSSSINDKEEKVYKEAISNYYHNNIQKLTRDLFRNTIVSLIMCFVGIIVITIMLILSSQNLNEVWNVVLEIIGWVFIWEAVDKFCFERHQLKNELRVAHKLKNANVKFIKQGEHNE